jgi:hypothetical protein
MHIPLKTYIHKSLNTWIEESKTLRHKHIKIDFGNQTESNLQRTYLPKPRHKLSFKAKITCPICKLKHNENTKTSQPTT